MVVPSALRVIRLKPGRKVIILKCFSIRIEVILTKYLFQILLFFISFSSAGLEDCPMKLVGNTRYSREEN